MGWISRKLAAKMSTGVDCLRIWFCGWFHNGDQLLKTALREKENNSELKREVGKRVLSANRSLIASRFSVRES
jgi:hypothetical protein